MPKKSEFASNKEFMEWVRSQKKLKKTGSGWMGDTLKSVGKFALKEGLNLIPAPKFVKDVAGNVGEKVIDFGVGKTGLGMRKRKKCGGALLLPG